MYKKSDMNLGRLMENYDTETECRDALAKLRWPEGVKCPRCQGDRHNYDANRYVWDCQSCGYQFSALTGTIFHDTHLPLPKWFMATYLMVESKKGMSANQMKRMLNVSYKTAWYLCHRIRAAMHEANAPLLSGTVEVDETYIGGKVRGRGKGYVDNKAVVAGIVQRGGQVRLKMVDHRTKAIMQGFIHENVSDGLKHIYTDESDAYFGVKSGDAVHGTVHHKIEEYVRGDVSTNTIESVWSLVKRSIVGSYHKVSVKHLDAYLDEVEWRQNNRENEHLFGDTLKKLISSETLPYQELVGE